MTKIIDNKTGSHGDDLKRAFYSNSVQNFCSQSPDEVLGILARNNNFTLEPLQRNTWEYEISLLQKILKYFYGGHLLFEYTIPRLGRRIDNVLIYHGVIYLLEFKVGEQTYPQHAIDQVVDYALDLKYFHKESHDRLIVPILICTRAINLKNDIAVGKNNICSPIRCNEASLYSTLRELTSHFTVVESLDGNVWLNSRYEPTPTIIEAAQALYRGHDVSEISRNDSGAVNLQSTSEALARIIDQSKEFHRKSICFVTGVPGAGKTLAGLNIANLRHNFDEEEHAVFLSGNGPLVEVLREALARDDHERTNVSKKAAKTKAEAFIQNIHHFRDDALKSGQIAPIERVAIFDEAQRAWTKEKTANFMKDKHGEIDWDMSEPEFLISVMDRHDDWAVIVCLVGGGQEINTGEAGIIEWFKALRKRFAEWNIYISQQLKDTEYTSGSNLNEFFADKRIHALDELHLAVSLRSFRSEQTAQFIKALLDNDVEQARTIYNEIAEHYPIFITRDLNVACNWVKLNAQGSERYGLLASSDAKRLRKFGIWVRSGMNAIDAPAWFLNGKDDIRSSYFLEETATEFDIQGLEIDYTIVAWDADFRIENTTFVPYEFSGTIWKKIQDNIKQLYQKNAYRVLLTRARQGFVVFLPYGDPDDKTRLPAFYDTTYQYLVENIGIQVL